MKNSTDSAHFSRAVHPRLIRNEKGFLSGGEHFHGMIGMFVVGIVLTVSGFPFRFFPDLNPLLGGAILFLSAFFLGHVLGIPIIGGISDLFAQRRMPNVAKLRKNNDLEAILALLETTGEDIHWKVRDKAAKALGKMGDRRAVEPLIKLLSDPFYNVRGSAAQALGELGDRRAVEPLLSAFKEAANSRYYLFYGEQAIEALGTLGDPSVVAHLKPFLGYKSLSVREDTAKVLGKLGYPSSV